MKRTIVTICITALLTAGGLAVAYSGALSNVSLATEGVQVVDPTDGALEDLDKLAGGDIMRLVPRNYQFAQKEIVLIKVKRSRFISPDRGRAELRWFDLTAIPIEQRLEGNRPWVSVLTLNGSIIRASSGLRPADIKLVVISTDKQVRIVHLI